MYRDHKEPGSCLRRSKPFKTPLKCVAQSCTFKCDTLTSLILDDSVIDKSVPTEPLSQPEPSHSCSNISDEQHEQVPFAVDETLFLQNMGVLSTD
ncbi:hypothetical protein F7725_007502 [Dissostichus mawsoni]|uniref:Uncharacterized protein n=1 Tax=Dissostichus mawsoni TaxID=36200 RepID=A0A7J5Y6L9_DISMA|nr:hypothetical protein F7725_007502 [Dissostichus mawsoni]